MPIDWNKVNQAARRKKPSSVTKYPRVARVLGAEGPKQSSPRPGGTAKRGPGAGMGKPGNKPSKKKGK